MNFSILIINFNFDASGTAVGVNHRRDIRNAGLHLFTIGADKHLDSLADTRPIQQISLEIKLGLQFVDPNDRGVLGFVVGNMFARLFVDLHHHPVDGALDDAFLNLGFNPINFDSVHHQFIFGFAVFGNRVVVFGGLLLDLVLIHVAFGDHPFQRLLLSHHQLKTRFGRVSFGR